jgi:hypothetical protein
MWSSIGGGDFPLWLFHPADYEENVEATEKLLLERIKRNEFGWMPMPTRAAVLAIRELDVGPLVFSNETVSALIMTQGIYGLRKVSNTVGLLNRGAVAGSPTAGYLFVSNRQRLYHVAPDLKVTDLGYEGFMGMLDPDLTSVEHSEREGDWFISDGEISFMLAGGKALTQVNQNISTIWIQGSAEYAVSQPTYRIVAEEQVSDDRLIVVTQEFDFGIRGLKTLTNVQVGYRGPRRIQIAIDARQQGTGSFIRTPYQWVNDEGIAYFPQVGLTFRVVLKSNLYNDLEIEYIQARWQSNDKRGLRGPSPISLTRE